MVYECTCTCTHRHTLFLASLPLRAGPRPKALFHKPVSQWVSWLDSHPMVEWLLCAAEGHLPSPYHATSGHVGCPV